MGKIVTASDAAWHRPQGGSHGLYSPSGRRKYLTSHERLRALEAARHIKVEQALFAVVLAWTGARVSEVLAITAEDCDLERSVIALRTLKRRRPVMREVPVPPFVMGYLEPHFSLTRCQRDPSLQRQRLWRVSRVTAWRWIKALMSAAEISGVPACPRGFRHGFGVLALHCGIPLNLLQRWLGHSRLSSTAIYADPAGPEERLLAERLWQPAASLPILMGEATS